MREIRRVGVWVRVSTGKQFEGDSPENHRLRALAYAQSRGWEVVGEYVPTGGVSGGVSFDHPEMRRMLSDLESGAIDGLIFSKLARLVRNTSAAIELARVFEAADGAMVNLEQNLDTSTPFGRMVYRQVASFDEWEREESADRQRRSIPMRAKMGRSTGGPPPYGYQWVDKQMIPHPEEAPIRRLVYELFAEHGRCKVVARILTERGYRNRRGKPFSNVMIDYMIQDPSAKGMRRANYTGRDAKSKRLSVKPESDWVWVPVPPIVSEDLWSTCNEMRREAVSKRAKIVRNAFSGLLSCQCGEKMYPGPARDGWTQRYRCKPCKVSVVASKIDKALQQSLNAYFSNPDSLGLHAEQLQRAYDTERDLLVSRERERGQVEREIEQLTRDYRAGDLSARRYDLLATESESRLAALDTEIARLQGTIKGLEADKDTSAEAMHRAKALLVRWEYFDPKQKSEALNLLVRGLVYRDGALDIDLHYHPTKLPTAEPSRIGKVLVRVSDQFQAASTAVTARIRVDIELAWTALAGLLLSAWPGQGQAWA